MSERTGRSKERTNNLRRRNRGRTVERSRSPLSDAGLGSDTMSKEQLLLGLKSLGVELPSTLGVRYIRQVYDRLTGTTGTQNQIKTLHLTKTFLPGDKRSWKWVTREFSE